MKLANLYIYIYYIYIHILFAHTLPLIRCEYGEMNVKYQMHLRLRELSTPSNPQNIHLLLSMMTHLVNRFLLSLGI